MVSRILPMSPRPIQLRLFLTRPPLHSDACCPPSKSNDYSDLKGVDLLSQDFDLPSSPNPITFQLNSVRISPPYLSTAADILCPDDPFDTSPAFYPEIRGPSLRTIKLDPCHLAQLTSPNNELLHTNVKIHRALWDTGAWGTVTCYRYLLEDYKAYGPDFPCPVRLQGATGSAPILPLGEGMLLVPAILPEVGFRRVRCYHSPNLTGTILNDEDLCGPVRKDRKNYQNKNFKKETNREGVNV